MTDIIKMNYELMGQMSQACDMAAQHLAETEGVMKNNVARPMAEGALLGQAGTAYVEAIEGRLSTAITNLQKKFVELKDELQTAVEEMQAADTTSRDFF